MLALSGRAISNETLLLHRMRQIKKLCSSVVVVDVVLVVVVVLVLVIVYNEDYKRLMNHTIYQVPPTFR